MAIGLRLKSTSAGEFNIVMRYLEMRREARKFTKSEHDVVEKDKKLQKLVGMHKLADAKETMSTKNKKAFEAAESAHRLLTNDFVCMKILEKMIREAEKKEKALIKGIKKGRVPMRMKKEELKVLEEEYEELESEVEKDVKKVLIKARRVINGLYHHCFKKEDMAFFIKRKTYFDWRLLNYFKLRHESKDVKKELQETKKMLKGLTKVKEALEGHVNKTKLKKEKKLLIEDTKEFVKACKKAIVAISKIFANSALLLDRVIGVLVGDIKEEDEWMKTHQVPMMMVKEDEDAVEKILVIIRTSLREINADIMQLYL
ncbi:hypothetical protein KY331_02240 [Candidatus Woesearchaeota archaeon]|nr:hypothetical protein [Candidatus Woesearchaeota archaeon]